MTFTFLEIQATGCLHHLRLPVRAVGPGTLRPAALLERADVGAAEAQQVEDDGEVLEPYLGKVVWYGLVEF